jgi:hypothetical protein
MSFRRPALTLVGTVAAIVSFTATPAGAATHRTAPTPTPQSSRHFSADIEDFSPYQPEKFCRHKVEPGVEQFEQLLTATYSDTAIVSDLRSCGSDTSEHYDGRAVDWGVDHRERAQRADGKALLKWLFATDAYGNHDAMFRRLGLMYIIWNHRIWGSWDQRWEPYSCSGVTACHVDHMHFSFGWAGAEAKTSWFSGAVSPPVGYPRHHKHHGHDKS